MPVYINSEVILNEVRQLATSVALDWDVRLQWTLFIQFIQKVQFVLRYSLGQDALSLMIHIAYDDQEQERLVRAGIFSDLGLCGDRF